MNQDLKEKWCAALESGTYVQGRRHLRAFSSLDQQTAHCCLGVLCNIMDAEWKDTSEPGIKTCQFGTTKGTILSSYGLEQVGLRDNDQRILAAKNDDGYDFKYIANYIRKYL